MAQTGLDLSVNLDVRGIALGEQAKVNFVAELRGIATSTERARPPLTIIFLIDISGSMAGEPIERVAESIEFLVRLLDPSDQVGVATFSKEAKILVPVARAEDQIRDLIAERVHSLDVESVTNIESGIRLAGMMMPERRTGERQVILLLSDGSPNEGLSSAEKLAELVESLRPHISMSTLGYGEHHNERVLLRISEAGGGRYHYIPDPVVCESELAQALAAQGDVVVDMIEFSLTLEEGVEILRFLGKPHVRLGHSNCKFSVPDLIDGQRYVVALELSLPRRSEPGQLAVLRAHASFRCAGSDTVESLERTLVVSVGADISCVLPEVRAAVLQVRAEEARWEARKLADSRQFERAALTLKKITRLLERETSYMTNDGSSLSELVEQIHDETRALESVRSDAEYKSIRRAQMGELISVGGPLSPDSGPMSSRFFDAVAGELPQAHLTILEGSAVGDCFKLTSPKMFIGRTPAAQIRLDDQSISRMQGMLRAQGGVFYLEQLASSPPMYVNGVEIERPRLLKAGDVISVGIFTIIYEEV